MTFGRRLAGTILQRLLAGLLFMLVVFSAGGPGSRTAPGRVQTAIPNLSMFVLPASCVVSAGVVVYRQAAHPRTGGTSCLWRQRCRIFCT